MTPRVRDVSVAATTSAESTRELAGLIASLVLPGDAVLLGGDLGAGKTTFTQGFGAALGVTERIVSPTFTIERVYSGRVQVHHLDVYRLETIHEALDLGLAEALDDGGVAVIEWGTAIENLFGMDFLEVHISLGDDDDDRDISFTPTGPSWKPRVAALAALLEPWSGKSSSKGE